MRTRYNEQLEKLHNDIIMMGKLCEDAIDSAMKSLFEHNGDMTKKTIELEKEIDAAERDIEAVCMKLILKQQPVAADLRNISSALKMISDMERIGDQAQDIAEMSKYITGDELLRELHLLDMTKAAVKMVNDSVDSFVRKDIELAKSVIIYDNIVDDFFTQIKSELIAGVVKNGSNGEEYFDIMMIAKYLERIGDHACNIAEWVIYSMTGEHPDEV